VLIIPAIDLRGGQCVRLRQGDYAQETVYGSDPAATAKHWVSEGARYLHIVDLDGAKQGRPVNGDVIRRILESAGGVPCELGGGLRTEADIAEALNWGVDRVVVGTKALGDHSWLEGACRRFPGKLVLGIDAINGKVATQGWLEISERSASDLARVCTGLPLAALVYTDISRDGMLQGPNLAGIAEIAAAASIPVVASGGITTLEDIHRLARLNIAGCIIGRALYEGTIDLSEAIKVVSGEW
jgi:phosphoribosylformimino-5-aminoimidazole carboxamide ribotide isomerase